MLTPWLVTTDGASAETAGRRAATIDTDLPKQIVQSIRLQALDLGGEAHVRLRPEYLGEVVVSVKVMHGAVTATLQADTAAVRRWIETNEASLRQASPNTDCISIASSSRSRPSPNPRARRAPPSITAGTAGEQQSAPFSARRRKKPDVRSRQCRYTRIKGFR